MDLDRFLNLLAAVFGAMGSVYVLKGIAALSPDLIERLSRSYWGFSTAQIDSLTAQKADAVVGIALVVIALLLALVNSAAVPSGIRLLDRRGVAIALVAVLAAASYIALVFIGEAVRRSERLAVGRIITARDLSEIFQRGKLPASEVGSLKVYARTLLGMTVDDAETPRHLLTRVSAAVGLQVPPSLDFSEVEKKEDAR